jgi:hypothetical protein
VTVAVANEIHPAKLVDLESSLPSGKTLPFAVLLQGDWDGGRAHLDISNEFRVILPPAISEVPTAFQERETGHGVRRKFIVKQPSGKDVIPRSQTAPVYNPTSHPD